MLLSLTIITFDACDNDDPGRSTPLVYNANDHHYGTQLFRPSMRSWEVIIDLTTGQVDSIPGTVGPPFTNAPIGARLYRQHTPDRRFHFGLSPVLTEIDMESFVNRQFSSTATEDLINPQFIAQGRSVDELIVLDTDDSVWRVDVPNQTYGRWINDLTPQGRNPVYVYQLGENLLLRIMQFFPSTSPMVDNADVIEVTQDPVIDFLDFTEDAFALVKHPERNDSYFLAQGSNTNGFRLGVLSWDGNTLSERIISSEDLAIDNLAGFRNTIHTTSNSYVAVAVGGDIESQENTLYQINLDTGELIGGTRLEGDGLLAKISGE